MSSEINPNNRILKFTPQELENLKGKDSNFLTALLRELEEKQNYSAYHKAIEDCAKKNPSMKYLGPNWYKIGDRYLKLGTRSEEEVYKSRLPMLTKEGITISPVYRDSAISKEGFSAMLLQVPGTETGDLHHFNDAYHLLTDEAKEAAYEDVRRLIEEMGFVNPSIFDPNYLSITPDSANQRIVTMNWDEFNPLLMYCTDVKYEDTKKEALKKAHSVLFQK